jgi:hypothetical protein
MEGVTPGMFSGATLAAMDGIQNLGVNSGALSSSAAYGLGMLGMGGNSAMGASLGMTALGQSGMLGATMRHEEGMGNSVMAASITAANQSALLGVTGHAQEEDAKAAADRKTWELLRARLAERRKERLMAKLAQRLSPGQNVARGSNTIGGMPSRSTGPPTPSVAPSSTIGGASVLSVGDDAKDIARILKGESRKVQAQLAGGEPSFVAETEPMLGGKPPTHKSATAKGGEDAEIEQAAARVGDDGDERGRRPRRHRKHRSRSRSRRRGENEGGATEDEDEPLIS